MKIKHIYEGPIENLSWVGSFLFRSRVASLPIAIKPLLVVLPLAVLVFPFYPIMEISSTVAWPLSYGIPIAFIILYLGLILIDRYFTGIFSEFWLQIDKKLSICNEKDCRSLFKKHTLIVDTTTLIWTMVISAIFTISNKDLVAIGIDGLSDPLFYMVMMCVIVFGLVTGTGFGLTVYMMYGIFLVTRNDLFEFYPLHIDNAGGFSLFGKYSFRTVANLGVGVLFIPTLIEFFKFSNRSGGVLVFLLVVLYTLILALAFIVPVVHAYQSADRLLKASVRMYTDAYQHMVDDIVQPTNREPQPEVVQVLDSYLAKLREIRPFPFQVSTLWRMLGTSLLPILMYVAHTISGSAYFSSFINNFIENLLS